MTSKYFFNKYYNLSNIISLILFIISIFFLIFKGLNYGVDFKGGTLIELRSDNTDYKLKILEERLINLIWMIFL